MNLLKTGILFFIILILFNPSHANVEDKLFKAIEQNKINIVEELLKDKINLNYITCKEIKISKFFHECTKISPLHYAIYQNNLTIVKLLINHKANVDITDSIGLTPIYYAIVNNNFEIISYLIDSKALINIKSHESFSYNTGNGLTHISPGTGVLQLSILFIHSSDIKIIKYLIEQGAFINETDDYGWAPLHSAILTGRLDIIKLLLDKGANINAKTGRVEIDEVREMFPEGLTPIEIAKILLKISNNYKPVVDFLNAYK